MGTAGEIVKIVAGFAIVTTLTILTDRWLSDKAAFVVLVVSLFIFALLSQQEINQFLAWARSNKSASIIGCVALFAAIGLVVGLWITKGTKPPTVAKGGQGSSGTTEMKSTSSTAISSERANTKKAERTPPTPLPVQLMFKDSALLTPKRRKRITGNINGVAAYLKGFGTLGIPVPDDLPPIGVDTKNPKGAAWTFNSQSDHKYYYDQFMLQQGALDKPSVITYAFLSFAVGRFIYKPPPLPPNLAHMTQQEFWDSTHTPEAMDRSYRWIASTVVVQYLNHSYWDLPFAENERPACPDQGNGLSYYFWQMRERFGKDFTDKLAVFMLRAAVDSPYKGTHSDAEHPLRYYLYERLTMADSVIDNENSKMPEIDSILKDCGWLPLT